MDRDLIDLGKQVNINSSQLIQESLKLNQQCQTIKRAHIIYQYNKPINFYIFNDYILKDITVKKIQSQFILQSQFIIPGVEDFYLANQDPIQFFQLFLSFLYSGKVEYKLREHYLPLLKLAIYFQCDILIDSLINQSKQQGIVRTFFLNFLCDIFNNQILLQTFQSNPKSSKFLYNMIQQNSPNIINHIEWHNRDRKEAQDKIKKAFSQVNPKLFLEFVNAFTKNTPQNFLSLTQFLFYIEKYENPSLQILEEIYLGRILQLVDEKFFNTHQDWFTQRCKTILELPIKKIQNQPFHMQHSKVCDLVNKSFQATCSHQICLNCFYQYLNYRQKFLKQNDGVPQKIRCFSRFLNKDICNCVFQDQDFLALKEYQINDFLNLFLQQKI